MADSSGQKLLAVKIFEEGLGGLFRNENIKQIKNKKSRLSILSTSLSPKLIPKLSYYNGPKFKCQLLSGTG